MSQWNIDPSHSTIGFSVKHLMISTVRGRFADVKGTLTADEAEPTRSAVAIEIRSASVDTRSEQRDNHLRSADFFDADRHPVLTFASRKLEGDPKASFKLIGDLTIRGVTREVSLDAAFEGQGKDPWGNERRAFTATGKLNRHDFGLDWNQALEAGGLLVSPDVKLEIDAQFIRA
jgi:polyisoprenoid-binding protein YceI